MVPVDAVCIDRYEANLKRRQEDGTLVPHPYYARPTSGVFVASSEPGVRPQAYVSRIEAASACENAGKRLCTVTEWSQACRGSSDTTYPYGATYVAGRCNVGRPHLLSILHGNNPKAWEYDDFNDPELDQRPGFLASTGEFSGCVSSYGAYDLVGNLHEWVSTARTLRLRRSCLSPRACAGDSARTTARAFSWADSSARRTSTVRGCEFVTMAHEPAYHDYSTGFRCCADR
jgi:formylglycine-generating enzyme required for sulfatase activity